MEEKMVIKSKIEEKDLNKFLKIALFRRSPVLLPVLMVITFLAAYFSWSLSGIKSYLALVILWVGFFIIVMAILYRKIKRKNIDVAREEGYLDKYQVIELFDTYLNTYYEGISGSREFKYNSLYSVKTTKDFIIIFVTKKQASFVKIEDVLSAGYDLDKVVKKLKGE